MLLEWLHQGCDIDLSADFLHFGVGVSNFPYKNIKKIFQNYFFLVVVSRSVCGVTISEAVARNSFAFCNSACADRIVMAVSRLLGAAVACVIL